MGPKCGVALRRLGPVGACTWGAGVLGPAGPGSSRRWSWVFGIRGPWSLRPSLRWCRAAAGAGVGLAGAAKKKMRPVAGQNSFGLVYTFSHVVGAEKMFTKPNNPRISTQIKKKIDLRAPVWCTPFGVYFLVKPRALVVGHKRVSGPVAHNRMSEPVDRKKGPGPIDH